MSCVEASDSATGKLAIDLKLKINESQCLKNRFSFIFRWKWEVLTLLDPIEQAIPNRWTTEGKSILQNAVIYLELQKNK
jgi:hypothetical protein